MSKRTIEMGCLPALFVAALLAAGIGAVIGLGVGVAHMVAGWFA